jgi:hypothetical protein
VNDREARIGRNEALFREVNERIQAMQEALAPNEQSAEFICECGDPACAAHIRLTLREYEGVRADPTTFVVVPGHDAQAVEQVVERRGRYEIVRKRRGTPAEFAARESPR